MQWLQNNINEKADDFLNPTIGHRLFSCGSTTSLNDTLQLILCEKQGHNVRALEKQSK